MADKRLGLLAAIDGTNIVGDAFPHVFGFLGCRRFLFLDNPRFRVGLARKTSRAVSLFPWPEHLDGKRRVRLWNDAVDNLRHAKNIKKAGKKNQEKNIIKKSGENCREFN
jgi:hypothetical protein